MPTNRIYVIGTGAISGTHLQTIERLPNAENMEVHVSDINTEALRKTQEKFPRVKTYNDTSAMLGSPAREDDIVIVSTPPFTHCSLTIQALESDRNVLCEKPFAMNQDEAHKMLKKAKEMNRLLGCCSVRFIGHRATETMKLWMNEGKLGEVYSVNWHTRGQGTRENVGVDPNALWRAEKKKGGGGVIMDWGAYDFTAINDVLMPVKVEVCNAWIAPPVTNAKAPEGVILDVESHAGASMLYHRKDGSVIPVSYERGHPAYGAKLELYEFQGTKGSAELNWLGSGLKRYFDNEGKVESEDVPCDPLANDPHMLQRPLCYFYDSVNGCPSSSVLNEQAIFNFGCLRAVYDCAETVQPQIVEYFQK
jgi:predicted dehydrogenase